MTVHWNASESFLEIAEMPFYWRLSSQPTPVSGIKPRLGVRIVADTEFDYLKFMPTQEQWDVIDTAYRQNENIGFLNPESGQMQTYGSSVNNFLLGELKRKEPKFVVEIGCGAGFSIQFLKQYGFDVLGVDPSEYSLRWSERLAFRLANDFFSNDLLETQPDFIYCNDVFEHVREIAGFTSTVHECLADEGTFCFATTNSTRSIELGDISMLEHQHVNMYTDRSIALILDKAGFADIKIRGGSYGNTFHVTAVKRAHSQSCGVESLSSLMRQMPSCDGYFQRAIKSIGAFEDYYQSNRHQQLNCYVPLRCIPYLSCVGDFGDARVFDSNPAWHGKYIDGYSSPIEGLEDISYGNGQPFFVGSLTFFEEIRSSLMKKGYPAEVVSSIQSLL